MKTGECWVFLKIPSYFHAFQAQLSPASSRFHLSKPKLNIFSLQQMKMNTFRGAYVNLCCINVFSYLIFPNPCTYRALFLPAFSQMFSEVSDGGPERGLIHVVPGLRVWTPAQSGLSDRPWLPFNRPINRFSSKYQLLGIRAPHHPSLPVKQGGVS